MPQKDKALLTTDDNDIDFANVIGWVGTLGLATLGALLGGCAGYLAGAGLITVIAASAGFGVCFLFGFCALGPAKRIVDQTYNDYAPPDYSRVVGVGLPKTFSLHVTVHNIRNTISTEGILGFLGKKNDAFVQVRCGRQADADDADFYPGKNPPKRTCVSQNETFEETFNIMVAPTENVLLVDLYDQDLVGDDLVGTARVDITKDVLEGGFPQKRGFKLEREEGMLFGATKKKTGTVILSFYPGDEFPKKSMDIIKSKHPLEWKKLEDTQNATLKQSLSKYGKTSYGSLIRDGTLMTKTSTMAAQPGSGLVLNAGTGSATQLPPDGSHV